MTGKTEIPQKSSRFRHRPKGEEGPLVFILKVVTLIGAITILLPFAWEWRPVLAIMLPGMVLFYFLIRSVLTGKGYLETLEEVITVIHVPYTEGEWKLKRQPWVTYLLILLNVLVYFLIEKNLLLQNRELLYKFAFLPRPLTPWNFLVSLFTHMFLHVDLAHLTVNSVFLWFFGVVVENRVGWKRFLFLYLATGTLGSILSCAIHWELSQEYYSVIGASGAVSGIMGVYMVRCYYKKLVFPLPILSFYPFLYLKLKVNALLVISLYWAANIVNTFYKHMEWVESNTAYLNHLGSLAVGMALALIMGLLAEAHQEKHRETVMSDQEGIGILSDPERSLAIALEKNPQDTELLLKLAREKSLRPTLEGREFYFRAIASVVGKDEKQAAEILRECIQAYNAVIDPEIHYRLCGILRSRGDLQTAARGLELLADTAGVPTPVRQKALLSLSGLYRKMGHAEAAEFRYRQYRELASIQNQTEKPEKKEVQ